MPHKESNLPTKKGIHFIYPPPSHNCNKSKNDCPLHINYYGHINKHSKFIIML